MADVADAPDTSLTPNVRTDESGAGNHRLRLIVFGILAVLWIGFLAVGQVRARFWIRNEFQIEWKSVAGIWRVALGELPGGMAIQALVLVSIGVVVAGVLGCLYLLVMTPDENEPDQEQPSSGYPLLGPQKVPDRPCEPWNSPAPGQFRIPVHRWSKGSGRSTVGLTLKPARPPCCPDRRRVSAARAFAHW